MSPIAGNLEREPLSEVVREIHLARGNGVLEVQVRGQRRRLHFREGELCLPGSHPLARRLATLLGEEPDPLGSARREIATLLSRIVEVTAEWTEGEFRFQDDPTALPELLVGPLPTVEFLMEHAVAQVGERDPVAALGGDRTRWILEETSPLRRRADLLSPAELWVLEQLQAPTEPRDLQEKSPMGRVELGRALVRLAAAGCIRPFEQRRERSQDGAGQLLERQVLNRFDERIRESLAQRPVALDVAAHRELLIDRLAKFGGMTHYELLEVAPSASIDEVHAAYERLAREAHPSHSSLLELENAKAGLQLLFERGTTAYLTLADPERRKAYDLEIGLDVVVGRVNQPVAQRAQEQRDLARQHYEQALAFAAREEYHFAIELLQLAVKADSSKSQYFLELGRLQARNPNWLRHAAESYRRAIELVPRDLASRLLLASLYERLEDPVRAKVQYHTVLRIAPENPDAAAALERLEGGSSEGGKGIFGRIFRR